MLDSIHEPPVSYLNKNDIYHLTVRDTTPVSITKGLIRYRTFVRVSFHQEEQRSNPGVYWQYWKKGRGKSYPEPHMKGPLAVEYAGQSSFIEVEQQSLDGFCVTWISAPALLMPECNISIRFDFLSTDFTRSKGMKGMPLQLCAKTNQVSTEDTTYPSDQPETCYCILKPFRDHGAQRKLSNDSANIMKTIEKARTQAANGEQSGKFRSKRRQSKIKKSSESEMPWDNAQQSSQMKVSADTKYKTNLKIRLATLQKKMHSTFLQSVLSLRGDEEDDPDLYPVQWSSGYEDLEKGAAKLDINNDRRDWGEFTSPDISSDTMVSGRPTGSEQLNPANMKSIIPSDMNLARQGLAKRENLRVACFYIRLVNKDHSQKYYRVIHLAERTVKDLAKNLVRKYPESFTPMTRLLYMNQADLKVAVDDVIVQVEKTENNSELRLIFRLEEWKNDW
ncbi:hypothetical protein N7478_010706 [Penicillium angulare]|uniref:uncharacterized protein n=1 Tax=Penicillium angulare TaxID=116970 RepID=UPI002540293A|nr:uncharacterized protein N7478_010706 [Penicillium angulare]KAJ5267898.1 hypothetical protein N7478_010706 [Penicillium angulare]